jgi:hypothetical protein
MGDIQTAIDTIKGKLPTCEAYCAYYDGDHRLAFASDRFATTFGQTLKGMRDNLCPIVVDAPADRMEVMNFSGDDADKRSAVADAAWNIWQREALELVSHDTHRSALKCGEGYLIVWPDDDGNAHFYPQDPRQCAVIEDEDTARKLFAAKQWVVTLADNKRRVRLNLYYDDRIEKFITSRSIEGSMDIKETSFEVYTDADIPAENPYGVIPMFKFKTEPVLRDAIPLQDALNKTLADRLVTQEFGAFRQRWATGLTPPTNEQTGIPQLPFKAGVDRLWFADGEHTKFGEFSATDLEPYLKAADSDRLEMARVTGTPLHFFSINTSDAISGKALKALESRFTKKVQRLCLNFGTVWANVMKFALQIEGGVAGDDNLTTQWRSPETRDEIELLDSLEAKRNTLEVPVDTLREEYGYTEEDITKFNAENAADPPDNPATTPVNNARIMTNGG